MADTTPAEFPLSFLEYRAVFEHPVFGFLARPDAPLPQAIFEALEGWGITLENVTFKQNPVNANEIQLNFNLPQQRITVQAGIGGLALYLTNPNWSQAAEITSIGSAVLEAVKKTASVKIKNQVLNLSMHLIPVGRAGRDFTARFLNTTPEMAALVGEPKSFGFSYYGTDAVWVVDSSALFPSGIFVRYMRTFAAESSLTEMASILKKNEDTILQILGLHERE